ncbi:MAG: hypothetical protein JSS76_01465 [Bacteroidetes bacterium]|nr:hypothetical protein [Bacteroidota bacterium]
MKYSLIVIVLLLWVGSSRSVAGQSLQGRLYTDTIHGFRFIYPAHWHIDGPPSEIIDRHGIPIVSEVRFTDTAAGSFLILSWHYPPSAEKLYEETSRQYQSHTGWYASGSDTIMVDGRRALLAKTELLTDGKGRALASPMQRIVTDFMAPKDKGEIQIQLSGTLPQDVLERDMRTLLSSFRFTAGDAPTKAGK